MSLNGEGILIACGNNYFNQLGLSIKKKEAEIMDWYEIPTPEQRNEKKIWQVVGGLYHTFAYISGTNQG